MMIDPIRSDPDWQNGEYKTQPVRGLTTAIYTLIMMGSSPLQMQKQGPEQSRRRQTVSRNASNPISRRLMRTTSFTKSTLRVTTVPLRSSKRSRHICLLLIRRMMP
jgi:homoserine acetyltransferase